MQVLGVDYSCRRRIPGDQLIGGDDRYKITIYIGRRRRRRRRRAQHYRGITIPTTLRVDRDNDTIAKECRTPRWVSADVKATTSGDEIDRATNLRRAAVPAQ